MIITIDNRSYWCYNREVRDQCHYYPYRILPTALGFRLETQHVSARVIGTVAISLTTGPTRSVLPPLKETKNRDPDRKIGISTVGRQSAGRLGVQLVDG